jgi:hypothetical protein
MSKNRRLGHQPEIAVMPQLAVRPATLHGVRAPTMLPSSENSSSLEEILARQIFDDDEQPEAASLVSTMQPNAESVTGAVTSILMTSIDRSPYQPRLEFNEEELGLLADAIMAAGGLNRPIIVRPSKRLSVRCPMTRQN